jgi:sec-independent protein translocase protein TatB
MLPGLGFSEILVLAVLALLVVGPKDLPLMLRKLGLWTAKMRAMAQEFRTGFDELARQAELDELRKEVDALRRVQPLQDLREEIMKPLDAGSAPPSQSLEHDPSEANAEPDQTTPEQPELPLDTPAMSEKKAVGGAL